jgi:hypothetical protein
MSNLSRALIVVPALLAVTSMGCADTQQRESTPVEQASQPLALADTNIWSPPDLSSKTRINTCFLPAVTAEDRQTIRDGATNSWEAIDDALGDTRAGVAFVGWETCPEDPTGKFVSIGNAVTGATSGSKVGPDGMSFLPTMAFDHEQLAAARTVAHEFGHVLGFSHEFTRADYPDGEDCSTSSWPAKVGLTASDPGSLLNYPWCGSSNQLTSSDIIGFSGVYGPSKVVYSSRVANSSGFFALHDGQRFVDASGNPHSVSARSLYIVEPEDSALAAQPVFYGETVTLVAQDESYAARFVVLGGEAGTDVMVQEVVTLASVGAEDEFLFVRFIGMGVSAPVF